jgi:branched-chain amino acid aminotransferase
MGAATLASVDGRIVPPEEATISILDDGLLRGDGAFEVIKLYDRRPFRLDDHVARLRRSADAILLDFDEDALRAEIDALLAEEGDPGGCIRIVITRGGRRLITDELVPDWPASARVAIVTLTPSEILAGVKSISYAANMHATRLAVERGADEAVYVDAGGTVLEAPTSSVFWTTPDGVLRTPGLEVGILDSITRAVVIAGLDVEEGSFPDADLRGAQSAFLASTTREIQPIAAIEGEPLPEVGGGHAEAATAALHEAFGREHAEAEA